MLRELFIKKMLYKGWYQFFIDQFWRPDVKFMNSGYANLNGNTNTLYLHEEDEASRYFIQLYHHLLYDADISNKDVLEVGSGLGGGCFYMMRYLHPKFVAGVDFSSKAIGLCEKIYSVPELIFHQGDAENMPLKDKSFDLLINVESSHCYRSMERFIKEVARVLRSGGMFYWADLQKSHDVSSFNKSFTDPKMQLIKEEDITANVVRALDLTNDLKIKFIEKEIPRFLRRLIREFAAVEGSRVYRAFKNRELLYFTKVFKKC